jgi:hypothetical protein
VPHDIRDQIVDYVQRWSEKTEIGVGRFIVWLGIAASRFYSWRERYGKANEHNGWIPRDFWLEEWEKKAIADFHLKNSLEGYRRLTFMMLDADIVAVSPSSVWRVLGQAGLLAKWKGKASKKGSGFEQPLDAHQHWHIDVSYINVSGTFYYESRQTAGAVHLLEIRECAPSQCRRAATDGDAHHARTGLGGGQCEVGSRYHRHGHHRTYPLRSADGRAQELQPQEQR